jgi:hypothetical protein
MEGNRQWRWDKDITGLKSFPMADLDINGKEPSSSVYRRNGLAKPGHNSVYISLPNGKPIRTPWFIRANSHISSFLTVTF